MSVFNAVESGSAEEKKVKVTFVWFLFLGVRGLIGCVGFIFTLLSLLSLYNMGTDVLYGPLGSSFLVVGSFWYTVQSLCLLSRAKNWWSTCLIVDSVLLFVIIAVGLLNFQHIQLIEIVLLAAIIYGFFYLFYWPLIKVGGFQFAWVQFVIPLGLFIVLFGTVYFVIAQKANAEFYKETGIHLYPGARVIEYNTFRTARFLVSVPSDGIDVVARDAVSAECSLMDLSFKTNDCRMIRNYWIAVDRNKNQLFFQIKP